MQFAFYALHKILAGKYLAIVLICALRGICPNNSRAIRVPYSLPQWNGSPLLSWNELGYQTPTKQCDKV